MQYYIVATNSGYFLNTADELHSSNSLGHYGILRQKWGVRRFQNYDGTLTPAGRERYHKMIASNVQKDRFKQTKGQKRRTKARDKVQKEIQKEFEATAEGQRLKKANDKLSKIQGRMDNRDKSYKDPDNTVLGKAVNRLGQNADTNRMAAALAEQNEAQKAAAKIYDQIMQEHKDDILNATIKDLKIYEIDDGREFLEKYIRGDEDATFSKVSRKQERAEAKEAAQNRREGKDKASDMERLGAKTDAQYEALKRIEETAKNFEENSYDSKYVKKVEKNGYVRYFYDRDELKASYLNAAKQLKALLSRYDRSKKERAAIDKANDEITNVAKKVAQNPELKAIGVDAKKINQEMTKEYLSWQKENRSKLSGMDAYANAWGRHVDKDPKLSKMDKQLEEYRQAYYDAAKREAYRILGTHESSYETDLLADRIGNMYYSEIEEDRSE